MIFICYCMPAKSDEYECNISLAKFVAATEAT